MAKKPNLKKPVAIEGEAWYFNLDPVVANLDEPGATRYIRTAFILEMSSRIKHRKRHRAFWNRKNRL